MFLTFVSDSYLFFFHVHNLCFVGFTLNDTNLHLNLPLNLGQSHSMAGADFIKGNISGKTSA